MAGDYAVEGEAMDTGVKAPGPEVDHGESPPPAPKPRVAVPDLNHDPPTHPNRDEGGGSGSVRDGRRWPAIGHHEGVAEGGGSRAEETVHCVAWGWTDWSCCTPHWKSKCCYTSSLVWTDIIIHAEREIRRPPASRVISNLVQNHKRTLAAPPALATPSIPKDTS